MIDEKQNTPKHQKVKIIETPNDIKKSSSGSKVLKAGLGYTIGNYLLKGLTFFTLPIFSRLLSTSDFGIYNTFIAYETILTIVLSLAIYTSYKNARYKYGTIEEGTKRGKDFNTYVSATILLVIISFLLLIIFTNIFSNLIAIPLELNRFEQNTLIIYSFSSSIITCFNTYVGLEYKYTSFLKIASINAVGNIVLSIIFIVTAFTNIRYIGRILGTVIPAFVLALIIIRRFFKQASPRNLKPFLRWGIKYSLPIVPHGISQVILTQFDRIMISRMVSSSSAGIYSFGYTIFSIIQVTSTSLDSVWSPWFYEKMRNNGENVIKKYGSLYASLMLIYSVVVMLISPEIVRLLGPKDYWDSVYCITPLVAGGYFSFLYTLPASIEYYYEKTKFIMVGTASAAMINILLNYIFTKTSHRKNGTCSLKTQ